MRAAICTKQLGANAQWPNTTCGFCAIGAHARRTHILTRKDTYTGTGRTAMMKLTIAPTAPKDLNIVGVGGLLQPFIFLPWLLCPLNALQPCRMNNTMSLGGNTILLLGRAIFLLGKAIPLRSISI